MSSLEELRDAILTRDVEDLLANDRRLVGVDISVRVRGGVAHLHGTVRSDDERQLVRRLVGRVRGIHAVWDVLLLPGESRPCILDLGCGSTKQLDWAIGVDRLLLPKVHLVADFEAGLPLDNDSVDQVFAVHVLEHVHNLVGLMNAIHRVLKPKGVLHVLVPNWQHVNAVADPTHVRFFNVQTFKAFCRRGRDVRVFRPLVVTACHDTIYADLQPVKDNTPPSDEELARFFD